MQNVFSCSLDQGHLILPPSLSLLTLEEVFISIFQ